jgi:hypothetical protein
MPYFPILRGCRFKKKNTFNLWSGHGVYYGATTQTPSFRAQCFKQIWKVGKVGKRGKVGTLLQGLLKMKLSSGKLQFQE